ncbi:MAG: Fic family protein [Planctomycetes bacterium]|nr:Fic family protein [Planctomycetota bacterium]
MKSRVCLDAELAGDWRYSLEMHMKTPQTPPDLSSILRQLSEEPLQLARILNLQQRLDFVDEYLHWDELRRRKAPEGLTHRQWWLVLKFSRNAGTRQLELRDLSGRPFRFSMVEAVQERLEPISRQGSGKLQLPEDVFNRDMRDRYIVRSLVEEAITSSQLEGAATTRLVAKEMLRSQRRPRDTGERMILNNYHAMEYIRSIGREPMNEERLLEVHRRVTTGTLDCPDYEGRFRTAQDNPVAVSTLYNEVYHTAPPAEELPGRIRAMLEFANGKDSRRYVHPVVRAIILHFWLAYDHPFMDGNGRTARALFYWAMLNQGYWVFEFISISQIIKKAPAKYERAFLYSETDDNDLTYFIVYHLDVIDRALEELFAVVERKTQALRETESMMRSAAGFNYRQLALLSHALRHPGAVYSAQSHRTSHNVTDQTARNDLYALCRKGLLIGRKKGRTTYYHPAEDLEAKLRQQE